MRTFGAELRDLRRDQGWSLGELARAIGVSIPYLSDVERGRRPPLSRERIFRLATAMDVPAAPLFAAVHREAGTHLPAGEGAGVAGKLAAVWELLDSRQRRQLERQIDDLIDGLEDTTCADGRT